MRNYTAAAFAESPTEKDKILLVILVVDLAKIIESFLVAAIFFGCFNAKMTVVTCI